MTSWLRYRASFNAFCIASLLLVMTSSLMGQTNEGREFWLGFMEHRDVGGNQMAVMITSRVNTSGQVEVPGRGLNIPFNINANEVQVIQLPSFVEFVGSEFINDNAIHITAREEISVYMHQYFGNRSEASVVLPKQSVGNEYFVISFTGVPDGAFGPGIFPSEFLIVANEDDTTVEYTLTGPTQEGKSLGSTHSVTLNAGESYQVRALSYLNDLTGSYLKSNKSFSLFAGTSWSQVPLGCTAMDNLLEQMYPLSTWGKRYVASPFAVTNSDLYRVIASEDNTQVKIEGEQTQEIILNRGAFYDFQSGQGAFIEGDKAISVAQYVTGSNCNGGIGDPSMVILNTVEQIRDTVTLFNSNLFDIDLNYINVICKAGEEDLIFFDGQNMMDNGSQFIPLGIDGDFLYTIQSTTAGAHTIFTQGCGIIAMAYGYGNLESYAYSGGASFTNINENPIPDGGCLNDTIIFDTGLPEERFTVFWDLGDGSTTDEHSFEHQYPQLGTYPLSVIIEDLCFNDIDTLYKELRVTLREDLTAIDRVDGCEGTSIQLEAFDLSGARFEWSGPEDFIDESQFPIINDIKSSQAGIYEVVGNISGCKTFPVEVEVIVYDNPTPDLGIDTVLCTIDGDRLAIDPGPYSSYLWQDGSTESSYLIDEEGIYTVEVIDDNLCLGIDTITIGQQCPTRLYIPNVFTPNGDQTNDLFGVSGVEISSMELHVYDRWGQRLFISRSPEDKWDGTYQGSNAEAGIYIWLLSYSGFLGDGTPFSDQLSGNVLLQK